MNPRASVAVLWLALLGLPGTATAQRPEDTSRPGQTDSALTADLDRIFADPVLARAVLAARVDRLSDGRTLYAKNADVLVMPASNMKLVTVAVAAVRLGWGYRFETRLEATGTVVAGTLRGDLVVTGDGDPSIGSPDGGHGLLFLQWADALRAAGIRRIAGRLIGDDDAFEDRALGAGWAWDYLSAGYAAPIGALNYNENAATLRIAAGSYVGARATVTLDPPGHALDLVSEITTSAPGSSASIDLMRFPGRPRLVVTGTVPQSESVVTRAAAVDNPTQFFVEAFRLALASRGIDVAGGAWDIDDLPSPPSGPRRTIATHTSAPLSTLAGYAMKVSQNQYGEVLIRALGRASGRPGTMEAGRQVVRETLERWGVPADALVMYDGSGLSRYNYTTAAALVAVLTRVWNDGALRGPFVSELPVAGHDGSLELRMRDTVLSNNVQAKTGTISNVRALSGFVRTQTGDPLVFSIVANHYTAANAAIDAVVERALRRLVTVTSTAVP